MLLPGQLAIDIKRSTLDQRRSCLRVHLAIPAEVISPSGEHRTALVRDISTSGAFVYASFTPELNADITVDFVFPVVERRMKIACDGKVVRVERSAAGGATGIAVQFVHHDVAVIH